jgi:hypothetical protein
VNSVILDGSVPQGELERIINKLYMLVVSKITKKISNQFLCIYDVPETVVTELSPKVYL